MATPCYIFDLDGTLADCEWRRHYVRGETKDWDAFFGGCGEDGLVEHVADICCALYAGAGCIVYVTGRPERCRAQTEGWIERHGLPIGTLYMRPDDDRRPDDEIKAEILGRMRETGLQPLMAFDDRDKVVAMWRANGVPCAQVAEGAF